MSDRVAGLLVTVDDEGGRLLSEGFTPRVQAKVGAVTDHYLTVMVLDTGERGPRWTWPARPRSSPEASFPPVGKAMTTERDRALRDRAEAETDSR
jgi:hypothetical protein